MIWFNLLGIACIIFIVVWFWLIKPKPKKMHSDHIQVLVKNGVYSPTRIEVNTADPITITFLRQDPSACSEWVNFERLNIHVQLPFNVPCEIALGKLPPGVYPFACQMQMYIGELIVIRK